MGTCKSLPGCAICYSVTGSITSQSGVCETESSRRVEYERSDISGFTGLDTNGDGFLYYDDIPQGKRSNPQVLSLVFNLVHLLSFIDLDGDGKISEPEFNRYQSHTGTEEGRLEALFTSWDVNKDGRVSLPELLEVMEVTIPDHVEALRDGLKTLEVMDSDGDNSLTLQELKENASKFKKTGSGKLIV